MLTGWMLAASVSVWAAAMAGSGGQASLRHLRPRDSLTAVAVAEGVRRSPTFTALVHAIEASTFIVYTESSRSLTKKMQGCLVHGNIGARYLRVVVKTALPLDKRIEVLAHELQHVQEVIEAGISNDPIEMEKLFIRSGYSKHDYGAKGQEFETVAALQVTESVRRELQSSR